MSPQVGAVSAQVTPIGKANPKRRRRSSGKPSKSRYGGLPHSVWLSENYSHLSGGAAKLLMDLACQFHGFNNGDLTVSFSVLKARGWRSKATISRAIAELLDADLVTRTRAGRFLNPGGRCALYAINWYPINDLPHLELDVAPTRGPVRVFKPAATKNDTDSNRVKNENRDELGQFTKNTTHDSPEVSKKPGPEHGLGSVH